MNPEEMSMDNEQTVTDERLEELAVYHEARTEDTIKPHKAASLRDVAALLRELQSRRAGDAETETLRRERDEARATLEAVRAECAVSHELRLSDYEQGRQDIANEVLDILDAPAPAPAEEPPQFFEIPPIDLTGGQDAADYVAEMRDREDAAALAAVREEAGE